MRIALTLALATAILLAVAAPGIHRWERENGYPYGKLCALYQNCQ